MAKVIIESHGPLALNVMDIPFHVQLKQLSDNLMLSRSAACIADVRQLTHASVSRTNCSIGNHLQFLYDQVKWFSWLFNKIVTWLYNKPCENRSKWFFNVFIILYEVVWNATHAFPQNVTRIFTCTWYITSRLTKSGVYLNTSNV